MPEHSIAASFNEHAIRNAKWLGTDFRLSIGECLFLQVRKSSKTWLVRCRIDGKASLTTIGKHPGLTLKKARMESAKMTLALTLSVFTVGQLVAKHMSEAVYLSESCEQQDNNQLKENYK